MARKIKAATRHRKLLAAHREHYDALLALQGGRCPLCGAVPKEGRRLDMDHHHGKMIVRGLLCQHCNRFGVKDWMTPEWARALADYLEDPPMQRLLRELVL